MNRYAYALNSPTSMFDPSGLMQQCAVQPDGSLYCWDDGTSNGGDPCNSDNEVCVNGSNGNSPTPTNPYPGGCVSSGTQGCISSTCASIYGCDGSPISGTSGTGGGGVSALSPPRTAVLSTSSKLLSTQLSWDVNSTATSSNLQMRKTLNTRTRSPLFFQPSQLSEG